MDSHRLTDPAHLALLSDNDLLARARCTEDSGAAVEALWERHAPALEVCLRCWARRHRLRPSDLADARQEAGRAFLEAVHADGAAHRAPAACFATFLSRVATWWLGKWLRSRARAERGLDRSVRAEQVLARRAPAGGQAWPLAWPDSRVGDPVAQAQWRELQARLEDAVAALPDELRPLWEGLAADRPLVEAGAQAGLSYDQAKRHGRRVRDFLRAAVDPEEAGAHPGEARALSGA
jgi:hypothetical protein